ncbi:hypothetical protein JKP88DRAFT_218757 [Tribonema minus]|uniref:Uncharacterized protein n=1 Tax=Tribonema minus TaxID=303371 RepID=A0A836CIV5_9STRA|nr:hypothetical protein JKP88DRAFT_218757 [Tribonema minus]
MPCRGVKAVAKEAEPSNAPSELNPYDLVEELWVDLEAMSLQERDSFEAVEADIVSKLAGLDISGVANPTGGDDDVADGTDNEGNADLTGADKAIVEGQPDTAAEGAMGQKERPSKGVRVTRSAALRDRMDTPDAEFNVGVSTATKPKLRSRNSRKSHKRSQQPRERPPKPMGVAKDKDNDEFYVSQLQAVIGGKRIMVVVKGPRTKRQAAYVRAVLGALFDGRPQHVIMGGDFNLWGMDYCHQLIWAQCKEQLRAKLVTASLRSPCAPSVR